MSEQKSHWERVYATKAPSEVSWAQDIPQTSLDFINSFNLPESAGIIDIGGGDSKLVDFLLEQGFEDITVLDISEKALDRAKVRLGNKADLVKWVVSDITEFEPDRNFDVWHDRAAFHFLTTEVQIKKYLDIAEKSVKRYMSIGTFSENGPKKCSGLEIKQYSEQQLEEQVTKGFQKINCIKEDHMTPFGTMQNFLFCSFERRS
jgi:SAM-dependent methyltransferase